MKPSVKRGIARRALTAFALAGAVTAAQAQTAPTYVVAFKQQALPPDVDRLVAAAGGTIVARLPEIGGIAVQSANTAFVAQISADASVRSADVAVEAKVGPVAESTPPSPPPNPNNGGTVTPTGSDAQPMPDNLGSEQWDKKKLNATLTGSYAVQQGRKDVRVAVLDTGADQSHIDVAPNLSPQAPAGDSVSFVPSEPTIQDFNGHGTWCASAVAAPINGVGVSGVAPNVTLVSLKVLSGAGSGLFLFTDQALVYAGLKHFDVASMSLGGFIPKCGNNRVDANGNPICDHPDYILLNRAIQFARANGVLPVAALGNDGFDLSDGAFFRDFVEAPGEMPGVVGVAATGYDDGKAFYSNFGTGKTDVSAPGGSTRDYRGIPGQPGFCPHGSLCRLIGAWSATGSAAPADPIEQCTGPGGTPPCFLYGYVQGTSMATPNTAGVAALIVSQYGDFSANNRNKPHMSPTQVEQILQISANNQPCPEPKTVVQGPGFDFVTATCQGASGAVGAGYDNFFGKGIVDALKAVTR
jgi:subtilisin family serine protease